MTFDFDFIVGRTMVQDQVLLRISYVGIRSDFNQNKFSRNTYFRMLKDQDFIQREMHNFELDKEHQKVVLRQNTKKCTNQRFIFPQPCMHHHKSDLITQNCCPSKGASLNTLNRISGFVLVEQFQTNASNFAIFCKCVLIQDVKTQFLMECPSVFVDINEEIQYITE